MLEDLISIGNFGGKRACTKRIRAFEAAWARLQSEEPGWPADPVDAQFQEALLSWLIFHRAMLIGELVPEAYRYLRDNPACEARFAFDYVIVDEYQDLNRAEQDLIDLLVGNGQTAIVGDIDQSIYRFRHANPEGIEAFSVSHPETHDENLDECRRCPIRVVTIADHLIRRNHPEQNQARLRPRPGNPQGEVHIVQWPSIDDEAQGLADYVSFLINQRNYHQAKSSYLHLAVSSATESEIESPPLVSRCTASTTRNRLRKSKHSVPLRCSHCWSITKTEWLFDGGLAKVPLRHG